VADYPFTTLEPYLGVVASPYDEYRTLVMADIPGLIEGAHEGAGLGIQFLRHIERCRVLAHLVDLSSEEDLAGRVDGIRRELEAHSSSLQRRPWLLVGTKSDALAGRGDAEQVRQELDDVAVRLGVESTVISAVTGDGVERLLGRLFAMLADQEGGG
jgi:GTP-binding protein